MATPVGQAEGAPFIGGLSTLLPGPGRRRSGKPYMYALTYRNPNPRAAGCVMTWEVRGGRQVYQIAIERDRAGRLHFHCTCADAVFRGDQEGHRCKHVRGFLDATRQLRQPADDHAPLRIGA
jgi:hypothetical protein